MEDGSALIVWNTHGRQAGSDGILFIAYLTEEGPSNSLAEELVYENSFTDHPGMANDTVYYIVTSLYSRWERKPAVRTGKGVAAISDWGACYILGKVQRRRHIISWPVGEPGLAGFELYRRRPERSWVMLTRLPAETGTLTDKDLAKGKIYAYRFVLIDANGKKSQPSEWVAMEP